MNYSNLSSNFYRSLKIKEKYILCDYASEDWGTGDCITAIKELLDYEFVPKRYSYSYTLVHSLKNEEINVYSINGRSIAVVDYVESYIEDRRTKILQKINDVIKPDIIICNSLSCGASLEEVKKLANDNHYKLVLFRNFLLENYNSDKLTDILNETNAESIANLIQTLPMYKQ